MEESHFSKNLKAQLSKTFFPTFSSDIFLEVNHLEVGLEPSTFAVVGGFF